MQREDRYLALTTYFPGKGFVSFSVKFDRPVDMVRGRTFLTTISLGDRHLNHTRYRLAPSPLPPCTILSTTSTTPAHGRHLYSSTRPWSAFGGDKLLSPNFLKPTWTNVCLDAPR